MLSKKNRVDVEKLAKEINYECKEISNEESKQSMLLITPNLEKYTEFTLLPKITENEHCQKLIEFARKKGYKSKDIRIEGDTMPSIAFKIHYAAKKASI